MNKHYQIVIIGGGTAGVTVASRLLRKKSKLKRENSNYRQQTIITINHYGRWLVQGYLV